jgi:hypothetical protein
MNNDCTRSNDIDNLDYKIRDLDFHFNKLELVYDGRINELEDQIKGLLERIIYLENRDI